MKPDWVDADGTSWELTWDQEDRLWLKGRDRQGQLTEFLCEAGAARVLGRRLLRISGYSQRKRP